ncbi:mitochondrial ribosomal large subunit component [Ascosphaera pollenicola]|nr:mitochondrial ribosomal large subunit component [Ascosphaera pollenicola]
MLSLLAPLLGNPRQGLSQALNFSLVLTSAFMLWKAIGIVTNSPSPIVVVLSGSMEPAFQRGDLLFLWNRSPRAEVGEVVVYNVREKDIPIVHRVVRTFPEQHPPAITTLGELREIGYLESHSILTKGDNNLADDTELYARGHDFLDRKADLIGSVRGYVPAVGYITIMLSEHPWMKTAMIGIMGIMAMLQRE